MEPAFKKSLFISGGLHVFIAVLLFVNFNFFKNEEILAEANKCVKKIEQRIGVLGL